MRHTPLKFLSALLLGGVVFSASAEDGVTDSTNLIGQTVGITGTVAGPVKEMNEGAMACLDQVNKKGGVHGLQRVDFGGLMVTYGPNDHTGSEFVELTMIGKNGRFIRWPSRIPAGASCAGPAGHPKFNRSRARSSSALPSAGWI